MGDIPVRGSLGETKLSWIRIDREATRGIVRRDAQVGSIGDTGVAVQIDPLQTNFSRNRHELFQ